MKTKCFCITVWTLISVCVCVREFRSETCYFSLTTDDCTTGRMDVDESSRAVEEWGGSGGGGGGGAQVQQTVEVRVEVPELRV